MAIYDPALMQAAGFDPFTTIDDLRSRTDIRNQRITKTVAGGTIAFVLLAYALLSDDI